MADQGRANETPLTRKERILELASIERDVTGSLLAAGKAVKALAGQAYEETGADDETANSRQLPADEARRLFEQHTAQYMRHVQAVNARLKRQIYALEEAGIIPAAARDEETQAQASAPRRAVVGTSLAATAPQREEALAPITNGGLGNFDIGWLNSRRDDVGRQKEAELWAEAKAHLERVEQQRQQTTSGKEVTDEEVK